MVLRGRQLRIDPLFRGGLLRKLGSFTDRQNVHADLYADYPVVSTRTAQASAVFFPVAVGVHDRAEVRLHRQTRRLRRLRLHQRCRIGTSLCGCRKLLLERQLVECKRLNRLQFRCFEVWDPHRLAQLRPRNVQVARASNQFLLARGHVDLSRHPIRSTARPALTWSSTEANNADAVSCSCRLAGTHQIT